jgi:hypothetical protein
LSLLLWCEIVLDVEKFSDLLRGFALGINIKFLENGLIYLAF